MSPRIHSIARKGHAPFRGAARAALALGAVAAFALVSCYSKPRTEVIVAIGTDLVPSLTNDPITCVTLNVYRSSDSAKLDSRRWTFGSAGACPTVAGAPAAGSLSDSPDKRYYSLYATDDTGPTFRLDLEGMTRNGLQLTRSAVVNLTVGETHFMRMMLVAGCLGNTCPGTCIDGLCRNLAFNNSLPPYTTGRESQLDCADNELLAIDLPGYTRSGMDCPNPTYPQCIEGTCYGGSDTCHNGVRDGDESDVDCGGTCPPCHDNAACGSDNDCESGYCDPASNSCGPPMGCTDGIRNGLETDVDCGGNCPNKCDVGQRCQLPCVPGAAAPDGGVRDGGVRDAGTGTSCPPTDSVISLACPSRMSCKNQVCCSMTTADCSGNANCTSGVCGANGTCVEAPAPAGTCGDGVRDRFESDIDCGGPECKACGDGKSCGIGGYPGRNPDSDCTSGHCCSDGDVDCMAMSVPSMQCFPASCFDGRKNQGETDLDCGGSLCPACFDGQRCDKGTDCMNRVCGDHMCQAAACDDCVKNGDETDADCGGNTCFRRCAAGKACLGDSDCASMGARVGVCTEGICALK